MKRAAWRILLRPLFLIALQLSLTSPIGYGEAQNTADILLWINDLRGQRGLSELGFDPLLERTAEAYAAALAERGVLSHVDQRGRRALERFRIQGGTAVVIGEILGSGPDLSSVTSAWEASGSHRDVICNPLWTHCGASAVRFGETRVWVLLFTSNRIDPLQILLYSEGYLIRGRLPAGQAEEPVLFSGIERLVPLQWDSRSGEFSFLIPLDRAGLFHRLGYRSRKDGLVITNTFYPQAAVTSDRGREPR